MEGECEMVWGKCSLKMEGESGEGGGGSREFLYT